MLYGRIKNILSLTVVFSVLVIMFTAMASATSETGTSEKVSLSIVHIENQVPVSGEEFKLYKIADVDNSGDFSVLDAFKKYPIAPEASSVDEWRGIAGAYESYILRDKIEPVSVASTDSQGKLTFLSDNIMTPGLYLVGGTQHIQGNYKYFSDPFCIILPLSDASGENLIYNVTASPKFTSKIILDTPDSSVTRRVLKVWKDNGNEQNRPDFIEVLLLRDGEIFEKAVLNDNNNWGYTWTGLDGNYRWTIAENEPENYKVHLTLTGVTFLLTNTSVLPLPEEETTTPTDTTEPDDSENTTNPTDEQTTVTEFESTTSNEQPSSKPPEEQLPNTGQLWWPVPFLTAIGFCLISLGLFIRRGQDNE